MSSSGSSLSKEQRHGLLESQRNPARHRHLFRWFLLIVALLGALILWQLNFFIHTLGEAQKGLESWQGARSLLGAFLTFAAMHISHAAQSAWRHLFH